MGDQVVWQRVPENTHPDKRMLRSPSSLQNTSFHCYNLAINKTHAQLNGSDCLEFEDGGRISRTGLIHTVNYINEARAYTFDTLNSGAIVNAKGEEVTFEEGYSPLLNPRVQDNLYRYGFDSSPYKVLVSEGVYPTNPNDFNNESRIYTIAPNANEHVRLNKRGDRMELDMGRKERNIMHAIGLRDMLNIRAGRLINAGEFPYVFCSQPVSAVLAELTLLNQS